jgi:hypothetical protein
MCRNKQTVTLYIFGTEVVDKNYFQSDAREHTAASIQLILKVSDIFIQTCNSTPSKQDRNIIVSSCQLWQPHFLTQRWKAPRGTIIVSSLAFLLNDSPKRPLIHSLKGPKNEDVRGQIIATWFHEFLQQMKSIQSVCPFNPIYSKCHCAGKKPTTNDTIYV